MASNTPQAGYVPVNGLQMYYTMKWVCFILVRYRVQAAAESGSGVIAATTCSSGGVAGSG
jgi:hypothetical protein